ncbi:hypothetical protein ACF0H5_008148 [Mactra antiquata]
MAIQCLSCKVEFNSSAEFNLHNCDKQIEEKQMDKAKSDQKECLKCRKQFSTKYVKIAHEKKCGAIKIKKTDVTNCKKCGKRFTMYSNRLRHEKKCGRSRQFYNTQKQCEFICDICDKGFTTLSDLTNHQNESHIKIRDFDPRPGCSTDHHQASTSRVQNENNSSDKTGNKQVSLICRLCNCVFSSHSELCHHRSLIHHQSEEKRKSFQNNPWNESDQLPWVKEDGTEDEHLKITYEQHRHLILKQKRVELTNEIRYNFPITNNLSVDNLVQQMEEIYNDFDQAFKVNMSFGIILINIETNRYRYFAPYSNENIFHQPMLISDRIENDRIEVEYNDWEDDSEMSSTSDNVINDNDENNDDDDDDDDDEDGDDDDDDDDDDDGKNDDDKVIDDDDDDDYILPFQNIFYIFN